MKILTALAFVFVTGITMISLGYSHHTIQEVTAQEKGNSESEMDFDKRMEELFTSGVKGDPSKFELLITQCDSQMEGELASLAKAWKANALILQSNPLFTSGNWQDGLKKWNEGLDLIKQADTASTSEYTKYRVCKLCLASWNYERDPQKKKEIAIRGIAALESFRKSDSTVWTRLPENDQLKFQLDAVKACVLVGKKELAVNLVKSMTQLAPESELTKQATHSLNADNADEATDKTSPRFDELVRADFFEGVFNDDPVAFKRAMDLCESTLAKQPEQYEAMAWLGSGRLFESENLDKKGDKKAAQELWDQGLSLMHRACAAAPDQAGVLIPRAATLISVGRMPMPENDRLALLNLAVYDYQRAFELQQAYFDQLSDHARGELLFGLADGWHQLGNKRKSDKYFQQIIKVVPKSEQADLAKMFLSGKIDKKALSKRNCAGCH